MSRRGHNEGTITQRKDGRWEARISLPDGKRRCFYAKTRENARQKLTKALAEVQQGLPVVREKETVRDFLTRWLTDVAQPKLRPLTYRRYQSLVKLHALPVIGKRRLAQLTPQDLQALLTQKLGEGLAPSTVLQLRAVLRCALGQALRWSLVSRNVAALA